MGGKIPTNVVILLMATRNPARKPPQLGWLVLKPPRKKNGRFFELPTTSTGELIPDFRDPSTVGSALPPPTPRIPMQSLGSRGSGHDELRFHVRLIHVPHPGKIDGSTRGLSAFQLTQLKVVGS